MTCIITTYKSNSANAFLNLWNEKRLQFLIATPSALIPAQMLNANIITNAYINPAVGVRYANNGLAVVANIIRHCSQLKILSISSINKELRGGGKPPPFWLLLYNLAQHKFRAVVNRRGCSVENVTFLHHSNNINPFAYVSFSPFSSTVIIPLITESLFVICGIESTLT